MKGSPGLHDSKQLKLKPVTHGQEAALYCASELLDHLAQVSCATNLPKFLGNCTQHV